MGQFLTVSAHFKSRIKGFVVFDGKDLGNQANIISSHTQDFRYFFVSGHHRYNPQASEITFLKI